ncbi:HPP family protein [Halorarius halobius]|uniref:HPP family protein n=1 Tax=Halorarius halobius TaxID=2962671 RepID=UPI0020CC62C7|nr:HPP family protein [Halorarius halobius]
MRETLRAAIHAAVLLVALGALVWATGRPFLFPSLGPTAYLLAVHPRRRTSQPRQVVGGHAIGVLAGLLAYGLLAAPLVGTSPPPALSFGGVRLAASAALSVGLTTGGMLALDARHAPACATTLIVSLGLLATPLEGAIVVASVTVLVAADAAGKRAQSSLAAAGASVRTR